MVVLRYLPYRYYYAHVMSASLVWQGGGVEFGGKGRHKRKGECKTKPSLPPSLWTQRSLGVTSCTPGGPPQTRQAFSWWRDKTGHRPPFRLPLPQLNLEITENSSFLMRIRTWRLSVNVNRSYSFFPLAILCLILFPWAPPSVSLFITQPPPSTTYYSPDACFYMFFHAHATIQTNEDLLLLIL